MKINTLTKIIVVLVISVLVGVQCNIVSAADSTKLAQTQQVIADGNNPQNLQGKVTAAQAIVDAKNDAIAPKELAVLPVVAPRIISGTPIFTSSDGNYRVVTERISASCLYFIVTDADSKELFRFDAQGGPYSKLEDYNFTDKGVYYARSSNTGAASIKFTNFADQKTTDFSLPFGVTTKNGASIKFIAGTDRANITDANNVTRMVNFAVITTSLGLTGPQTLQVVGFAPDGQYQIVTKPITASCEYYLILDKNNVEIGKFDARYPLAVPVSSNVTNEGVYVARVGQNGSAAIKYYSFTAKTLTDVALPVGVVPKDASSIRFVAGTDQAYITDASKNVSWVNLKLGLKMIGTSPDGQYQVVTKPMTASAEIYIILDKNNVEIGRFDARYPLAVPVSYNVTDNGVYVARVEQNGSTAIKFYSFTAKTLTNVTLPATVVPKSAASIKFVAGTSKASIIAKDGKTYLVDLITGVIISKK